MKTLISYLFFILYIIAPFISLIVTPDILGKNFISFENLTSYMYIGYAISCIIMICAMVSIKYLFGGSLIGILIVLGTISFITAFIINATNNNLATSDLLTYLIQFAKNVFFYWLINFSLEYLKKKEVNIKPDDISVALFEKFRNEIIFKFEEKLTKLPKLAWYDYSLSGFLFAKMVKILDSEIHKLKPEYICSFENRNYENLFGILTTRLETQYPNSSIPKSIMEMKSNEGFKKGMNIDDAEFNNYLDKISKNYSQHPDKIDRSNMIPQADYIVKQNIKKIKGKVKETFDELKGIKRLKNNIQDVKNLRDEKTITEEEYVKLRKSVLEKYVASNNKDASSLKSKLNEIENLKNEKMISEDEFAELRKIIINKYA